MNLTELTRKELIELIAATLFRVTGFTYILSAFSNLWHLESDIAYVREVHHVPTPYDNHLHQLLIMDIIYNLTIAAIMCLLSVALGRLVCRGLDAVLETQK